MLLSIYLMRLRNSKFIQFFANLISILLKYQPKELGIEEQLQAVVEEIEKIKPLHGSDKSSEISAELKDLDDFRDDCINGIEKVLDGYTNHYDPDIKKTAELLLSKIQNYGPTIARQNYPTETASLTSITDAFISEEKFITGLAKLTLTTWVGKLKEKNDFFNQRYLDRVDESAKKNDDKIKELRQSTTTNYYELRDHLNAHYTLKKEKFSPIMAELNVLIDEYNGIIKRRRGSKDTEDKED